MFPVIIHFPKKFIMSTMSLEVKLVSYLFKNKSLRVSCRSFNGPDPEETPPKVSNGTPAGLI
jgi:hypothetical protein